MQGSCLLSPELRHGDLQFLFRQLEGFLFGSYHLFGGAREAWWFVSLLQ